MMHNGGVALPRAARALRRFADEGPEDPRDSPPAARVFSLSRVPLPSCVPPGTLRTSSACSNGGTMEVGRRCLR